MGVPEQLSAMLFELRAAGSPVDKAKALARAWRFVRRLSPHDRQFLAREAGFEGAEELLDTISAKRGGVGPAVMLQLLNSIRGRGDQELVSVIAELKDPESREAMLVRGADALAEAFESEGTEDEAVLDVPPVPIDATKPETEPDFFAPTVEEDAAGVDDVAAEPDATEEQTPETEGVAPEIVAEAGPEEPEPLPTGLSTDPIEEDIEFADDGSIDVDFLVDELEAETSLVDRLLCLREAIPALGSGGAEFGLLVEAFPEGWARRRALTALLEAGLPSNADDALDLIEDLERAVDRRWCLGVLIDRGDLQGAEADRALELSDSPALRRRIEREGRGPG